MKKKDEAVKHINVTTASLFLFLGLSIILCK